MSDQNEWVSLGEAADILGVHPSTVRHWADSGELPSQRTPGGHRRFRRRDLQQLASSQSGSAEMAPAEAQLMMQSALGRARLEVSGGQLEGQPWYDRLDEQARRTHRQLGRRLLELLTRYLADADDDSSLFEEVRQLGHEYATLSRDQNMSLADSVRAFLFFRDLLTDSVIQLAEMLSLHTPGDWGDRLRQVNTMTDELLLELIEEYEQPQGRDE
jgi:excisionase family DNA binding protein